MTLWDCLDDDSKLEVIKCAPPGWKPPTFFQAKTRLPDNFYEDDLGELAKEMTIPSHIKRDKSW